MTADASLNTDALKGSGGTPTSRRKWTTAWLNFGTGA
jgi:hypothetical protein